MDGNDAVQIQLSFLVGILETCACPQDIQKLHFVLKNDHV